MTGRRSAEEQARHDLAVRRICRARFAVNTGWEAFTNPGDEMNYALALPEGTRLFPDIVVRARGLQASFCVAEVETEATVDEEEADEWEALSRLGRRFILFVPAGLLLKAREICHRRGIRVHAYAVYELTMFWVRVREFPV